MLAARAHSWAVLPERVTTVAEETFMGDRSLDKVELPEGCERIESRAFAQSGLRRIRIPSTVDYIADDAFEGVVGLTIESQGGDYAWRYARRHGIDWTGPEWWWRQDIIDMVEEEPEDEEYIDLEEMTFDLMSTEGIENEGLIALITQFNDAQTQLQADVTELIACADEVEEPLNALLAEAAEYAEGIAEDALSFGDATYAADMDALSDLPKGLALTAIYPDPENAGMLMEADGDGETVYVRMGAEGATVVSPVQAASVIEAASVMPVNRNAADGNDGMLRKVLAVAEAVGTNLGTWVDLIDAGLERGFQKAMDAATSAQGPAEVYRQMQKYMFINDLPENQINHRIGQEAQEHLEKMQKVTKGWERVLSAWKGLSIGTSIDALTQDVMLAEDILTVNGHGHPTADEQSDPEWMALVEQLERDKHAFETALTVHILFNIAILVKTLNEATALVKALAGPAGIAVNVAVTGAVALVKKLLRNVVVQIVLGVGLDEAVTITNENMWRSDRAVHAGPVPPDPDPIHIVPPLPDMPDAPEPVDVPDAEPGNCPSGDIPINADYFPDASMREFARQYDYDDDGILSYAERGVVTMFMTSYRNFDGNDMPFTSLKGLNVFYNLEIITILGDGSYSPNVVELSGYPSLRTLNLGWDWRVEEFPDEDDLLTLDYISVNDCPNIQGIMLYNVQCGGLKVKDCPQLCSLNCGAWDSCEVQSVIASECPMLQECYVMYCGTSTLELTGCTNLESIWAYGNQLQEMDLSGCEALRELSIECNQLTELNLTGCSSLERLECQNNLLTRLDLSDCVALTSLNCASNLMTELDLSGCPILEDLNVADTRIGELDVSGMEMLYQCNTVNSEIETLSARNCPALQTVNLGGDALISVDLTGCTALEQLEVHASRLERLNVSGCTALTELRCDDCRITDLNLSGCAAMTILTCGNNRLEALDLQQMPALEALDCYGNQITRLDASGLTALIMVYCGDNQLIALKVLDCAALEDLYCRENQLGVVNLRGCVSMSNDSVHCDGNVLILW